MALTWIGFLLLPIGAWLLFRSTLTSMLIFVLATSLLGGSAAINLPALGGSSIPPTYFALGFLCARICLPGGAISSIGGTMRLNAALVIFVSYGLLTAFILPRVFAGKIDVTPMRAGTLRFLFETAPLAFSSQNVTTAVYLLGTLIGAIMGATIASRPKTWLPVLKAIIVMTWLHVGLGILAFAFVKLGKPDYVDLIRNGSYAQLQQSYGNFIRITGFFPEASAFASYGFVLLVVMVEAWLRDLRPRQTGWAATIMALTLVISTSSSAYVSLAGYLLVILVRGLLFPTSFKQHKVIKVMAAALIAAIAILMFAVSSQKLLADFTDMLRYMTVDKGATDSGLQRKFWAKQGLTAFTHSYGLGVGPGSFRSSSMATAIAGSMGVIGLASFAAYLLTLLKPFRSSTYSTRLPSPEQSFGICLAWAAVVGLIPQLIAAASPDPGLLFGLLAGMGLTWRSKTTSPTVEAPVRQQPEPIPTSLSLDSIPGK